MEKSGHRQISTGIQQPIQVVNWIVTNDDRYSYDTSQALVRSTSRTNASNMLNILQFYGDFYGDLKPPIEVWRFFLRLETWPCPNSPSDWLRAFATCCCPEVHKGEEDWNVAGKHGLSSQKTCTAILKTALQTNLLDPLGNAWNFRWIWNVTASIEGKCSFMDSSCSFAEYPRIMMIFNEIYPFLVRVTPALFIL